MLSVAALLSACGGGGGGRNAPVTGGNGGGIATSNPTPGPTPPPVAGTGGGCSLRERQDWAAAQLREWYLFPETLPTTFDPTPFGSVDTYVDALTATARGQRRDRFFTYLTSIREEDAFYASGASAGFGIRLSVGGDGRQVFINETFEGTPAAAAGIDRGDEILAIGSSDTPLRSIPEYLNFGGPDPIAVALGEDRVGVTRTLRIRNAAGTRLVTLAKADYDIPPVSSRYGARVLTDGGRRVGYINLRTFIASADPALRAAFAGFRRDGITDVIVDLRYNGGGLISIAELMVDLLGRDRTTSDVQGYTSFRPEKASNDIVRFFERQPESIAPTRVAFIGTGGTASASELVVNAFTPYLRGRSALIGGNTFGKPVGQIALDRPACDDRLRVVAIAVQNSARSAAYFDGLAATVGASCAAGDDLAFPLGDPRESSVARALDFLAARPCTPISPTPSATAGLSGRALGGMELLMPSTPTAAQREVPGLF
ncbi:S41 family peptidase [Sphingomonas montana]|uniref:S41 family peptidase n=1 Tax=Sphingomonas montana TaxID=1843236 RepID=UPI0009F8E158|nr:S41 family peptidase [Sphingomonas montana]